MRRAEREITGGAELEDILRRATVVHLGLVDQGKAYVVPMNFGYADGCLLLHSAPAGRKIEILRREPAVSFAVVADEEIVPGRRACDWTSRYRCVMGCGKASLVEEPGEKARCLDRLMANFTEGPFEYAPEVLERTAVIRIEIESMTGKKLGY